MPGRSAAVKSIFFPQPLCEVDLRRATGAAATNSHFIIERNMLSLSILAAAAIRTAYDFSARDGSMWISDGSASLEFIAKAFFAA